MSETGKKIYSAAQAVENSLAATVKDLESGIGSFFSGGNARTNDAEAVREQPAAHEQEQKATSDTAGQVVANQQIGGKDYYLVQTENQAGQPERALFEKNGTDYQAGQDVTVKWNDGKPASAQAEKGVELPWGGEIAGQSQFTGQSQYTSQYHDDGQGL